MHAQERLKRFKLSSQADPWTQHSLAKGQRSQKASLQKPDCCMFVNILIVCLFVCLAPAIQKIESKYKLRNRDFSITHSKKYNFLQKRLGKFTRHMNNYSLQYSKNSKTWGKGNTVFPSCQYSNSYFSTK